MRKLVTLACAFAVTATLVVSSGSAAQGVGVLSVGGGRGTVTLDVRGSVLGRLASGTLRVTDHTPRDRFSEIVKGSTVLAEQVGPRTVVYRGTGLRFRMVGGAYRIAVRGSGIAVSAVGRGVVVLAGEPRNVGDSTGVYSLVEGADCSVDPTECTPLPPEPERFVLGAPAEDDARRTPR